MKIFIACSKHFYYKISEIKKELEKLGHEITLPNSFEEPFKEEEMKKLSREEHSKWKQSMMKLHEPKIKINDAILVLNFEKNGQQNYIGGATFMEIVKAWELKKIIFLYNPIPENIFSDEIKGINPEIINGDLSRIKEKRVGVGVGVMILNKEGKILFGLRNEDVKKAGSAFKLSNCWGMPGGKLKYEESFEECARREIKEETNLSLNNLKLICINDNKNEHARFVTIGFLCEDFEGELKIMEPEEITEWKWFDINNLPENMYFPSVRLLENYRQQRFYTSKDSNSSSGRRAGI